MLCIHKPVCMKAFVLICLSAHPDRVQFLMNNCLAPFLTESPPTIGELGPSASESVNCL